MDFDKNYFNKYYRNYLKQNPPYKLKTYLNFLLKYTKRGSLLDIGCSCGLFVELSSEYFDCFGMDVDSEVVSEAAKRVPQSSFVSGALPNIPFKDLDIITLLDVIEHVQDLRSSLEALKISLRPGGIALMPIDLAHKTNVPLSTGVQPWRKNIGNVACLNSKGNFLPKKRAFSIFGK